ncbi:MAG: Spy/CpxP family protein refolding chaperone [Xenophilus sp.]
MISLRQRMLWAGVLASAAFAASAQTPPATDTQPAQAQGAAPARPPADHKRFEREQQHRAERLAALKGKLKLDASQEGAWATYTAALQPPADAKPPQRPDRAEFAKLTTPERLDRLQARQAERAAEFAKRADATKAFYAQLSPAQQKTFDAESLHFGPPPGGPHDPHHGGPRHQPRDGEAPPPPRN